MVKNFSCSKKIKTLIVSCLNPDPKKRPSAMKIRKEFRFAQDEKSWCKVRIKSLELKVEERRSESKTGGFKKGSTA